jgi:hypothetical protein
MGHSLKWIWPPEWYRLVFRENLFDVRCVCLNKPAAVAVLAAAPCLQPASAASAETLPAPLIGTYLELTTPLSLPLSFSYLLFVLIVARWVRTLLLGWWIKQLWFKMKWRVAQLIACWRRP